MHVAVFWKVYSFCTCNLRFRLQSSSEKRTDIRGKFFREGREGEMEVMDGNFYL